MFINEGSHFSFKFMELPGDIHSPAGMIPEKLENYSSGQLFRFTGHLEAGVASTD